MTIRYCDVQSRKEYLEILSKDIQARVQLSTKEFS
jgi:hypothetical protein